MEDEKPQNSNDESNKNYSGYGGGYGKRPLWQWVLIYLVVGGLVYYAIYYLI